MEGKETVCVTGAGGYQASWLVKLLLSLGYVVHGTVRDPNDEKNYHLKKLENARESLQLFKADLLDFDSLCTAIEGCSGVFHVACPVPSTTVSNPEVELFEPTVKGTCNVLKACSKAKVKKFVMVSSISAIILNPNWPKDQVMDESCWTDKEFCKTNQNLWFNSYSLAKTEAESMAWEHAKSYGLDVVSVCPSVIIGPMLQSTLNSSSLMLLGLSKGGLDTIENNVCTVVDVRDVAEALVLVYKKIEAKGRYICASYPVSTLELVNMLKSLYPNNSYPKQIIGQSLDCKLSSEKLQELGWKYRPLEETLVDSIEDYYEKGLLKKA